MLGLARAQVDSGCYAGVGLGLITYRDWPEVYEGEVVASGLPVFRVRAPKLPGTVSFVEQCLVQPPIGSWVTALARQSNASQVVAHFHNAWMSGVFLPVTQSQGIDIRTIVTFHGVNGRLPERPIRYRIHRWMARRTDLFANQLTSVNRAHLPLAQSLFGIRPDRFRVIPNGVTDTGLRGCPRLKDNAVLTVGCVGAIVEGKGWHFAVEAVLRLTGEGRRIRLILAGDGPGAADARKLADAHPGVIEYRGFVQGARDTLMPELDLLLVMSDQEGLPMSIIEALSVGVPVVGTAVGGIPEAIIDGQNGCLVERSAAALYVALGSLLADSDCERLERLSRGARHAFEQRYDVRQIVGQYDSVYRFGHGT
jgi:glycosyltransferase involved in cell wall biosynthesis